MLKSMEMVLGYYAYRWNALKLLLLIQHNRIINILPIGYLLELHAYIHVLESNHMTLELHSVRHHEEMAI